MNSICILYILTIVAAVHCYHQNDWQHFKRMFNKNYVNATEDAFRKQLFEEELDYIQQHNQRFKQGDFTFSIGINNFSDWTQEEFRSRLVKKFKATDFSQYQALGRQSRTGCNPPFHNWRDFNMVTEVKNQGECESSWTYATVGAIEGAWAKETGSLYNLSGQEMVDCGAANQNNYETVIELGGIMTEDDYPYSCGGRCRYQEEMAAAHISSFTRVLELREDMMGTDLYEQGPISVMIDGSLRSFKSYESGIYFDPNCSTESGEEAVNQGLLLVGYDMRQQQEENHYWIAKNSWGTSWGMDGYIYMRMWVNSCNIARYGIYPLV